MQCGGYFAHGNTVAKITATLLEGGNIQGEERFCVLFHFLIFLEGVLLA